MSILILFIVQEQGAGPSAPWMSVNTEDGKTTGPILSDRDEPPHFTEESLNSLIRNLWSSDTKRVNESAEDVGSIQWIIDMEGQGYTVERYSFENVREMVRSVDMETGQEENILSDPMDVYLFVIRRGSKVEKFYLIREIHHRYRTGEISTTLIKEVYVK